jgi:hypothetical protein
MLQISNEKFPDKWDGRNEPIPRPQRSPDFTLRDIFSWAYTKNIVHAEKVTDLKHLRA